MSIVENSLQKNRRAQQAAQATNANSSSVAHRREARGVERRRVASAIDPDQRLKASSVTLDPAECRRRRLLLGNVAEKADGSALAAYRILRTRLLHRARTNNWSTIAVTSASTNDGKTLTSINLVLSMAREKSRDVVLLDLDMRNPSVFRTLGIEPPREIKHYLETGEGAQDLFVRVNSDNLYVAGNIRPVEHASELLSSRRFEDLIDIINRGTVDPIIIIDMPPVILTDDVFVLTPRIDATLVVASEGVTAKSDLAKAMDLLKEFTVAGVVVNKADQAAAGYGYGYEYSEQADK